MTDFRPDPLDDLLRSALQARPAPQPRPDLAKLAMEHAAAADQYACTIARIGRWSSACSVAAGLLVLAVLLWAFAGWGSATDANSQSTGSSALSYDPSALGLAAFALALVGLALAGLLSAPPSRPATLA